MPDTHPPRHWSDVPATLLFLAAQDLDADLVPRPTLIAFAGDEPYAVVELRPFETDELLQACIEVLSLLLPLGADRLALSMTVSQPSSPLDAGTSTIEEPAHAVGRGTDVVGRRLQVIRADAHGGGCQTEVTVTTGDPTTDGWRWKPLQRSSTPRSPLADALAVSLDARDELVTGPSRDLRIAAQLGRVLLLGHQLAIAPGLARRLELATAS